MKLNVQFEELKSSFEALFDETNDSYEALFDELNSEFDVSIEESFLENTVLDYYSGAYEITPAAFEQVLMTNERAMKHNVVVKPIPQNYGLISYNGYGLTVS